MVPIIITTTEMVIITDNLDIVNFYIPVTLYIASCVIVRIESFKL